MAKKGHGIGDEVEGILSVLVMEDALVMASSGLILHAFGCDTQ